MVNKFLIIVEGKNDIVFIRDLIFELFEIKEQEISVFKNEIIIEQNSTIVKLLSAGGYTAIANGNLNTRLQIEYEKGFKIIVIQDADNPEKENGGVINRIKYLKNIQDKINVNFEIFLFPNNNDNGDIEDLLLNIVKKEKYDPYYINYKKYSDSICEFSCQEHGLEIIQNKFLVFNYIQVYKGMNNAKEENRKFDQHHWNFSHKILDTLKEFLKEILKNSLIEK